MAANLGQMEFAPVSRILDVFKEWYDRQSLWVRTVLFPVLFAAAMVFNVFGLAVILPIELIKGSIQRRRFWRNLEARGQVAKWTDVEKQVSLGNGTLIVEIGPKGPGCSWLIDLPRYEIDRDHNVPSWQKFETTIPEMFSLSNTEFDSLNKWTLDCLGAYVMSARALVPTWSQIEQLTDEAKKNSVLAIPYSCEGSLRACPKS